MHAVHTTTSREENAMIQTKAPALVQSMHGDLEHWGGGGARSPRARGGVGQSASQPDFAARLARRPKIAEKKVKRVFDAASHASVSISRISGTKCTQTSST